MKIYDSYLRSSNRRQSLTRIASKKFNLCKNWKIEKIRSKLCKMCNRSISHKIGAVVIIVSFFNYISQLVSLSLDRIIVFYYKTFHIIICDYKLTKRADLRGRLVYGNRNLKIRMWYWNWNLSVGNLYNILLIPCFVC